MNQPAHYSQFDAAAETQRFIVKVYSWMSFALIVTGGVAVWTASNQEVIRMLFSSPWFFAILVVAELALVASLVSWVQKMSSQAATLVFVLYSILNGITLAVIFLVYTADSIASTFFITAGTFAIMSAYGYFTKRDLTSTGMKITF